MGRQLAATVHVAHPVTHERHTFRAGDEPPAWAAEMITNPAAWAGITGDSSGSVPAPAVDVRDDVPSDPDVQYLVQWAEHVVATGDYESTDAALASLREVGDFLEASAGSPAPPSVAAATVVEMPPRNGSKAAWLAYAIFVGADADEAAGQTRDELADLYGSSEE